MRPRVALARGRVRGSVRGAVRTAVRGGRLALALGLGLAAGACSSQGPGIYERVGSLVKASVAPPKQAPAPKRTRAELNKIPYATIGISFGAGFAYLVPIANNGGYLDYRDAAGRSVRMLGGALDATEGVALDLAAVRFAQNDPIAHRTPLADWPRSVFREYQFQPKTGQQYGITLDCAYQRVARETIDIVEIKFDVVRMSEVCTNQARQVVNTYWVEPDSGFIWKSEQWAGPVIGKVTIEIIRPFAG